MKFELEERPVIGAHCMYLPDLGREIGTGRVFVLYAEETVRVAICYRGVGCARG